ncbi:MAG TPA: winged helix-turn-helix domain-containing protein [Terriglobales bacterium]|nr:winged helix-turn-helix domain-containing protein [Terriglobales bacterium]
MCTPSISGKARFGVFEVDLSSGELRKRGIKIKLHDQPFRVLAVLLEHPGEVITREQIRQRLWSADTFVDAEVGLNSAIMKLRDALGDSAENPRFIETLPRRGYRFIVPVEHLEGIPDVHPPNPFLTNQPQQEYAVFSGERPRMGGGELAAANGAVIANRESIVSEPTARPLSKASRISARVKVAFVTCILALLALAVWWKAQPAPGHQYTIAVLPFQNLSPEPGNDYFSDGLTDEIINNLSVIDRLEVKSRTSSFTFKDKPRDIHAVGTQLGAKLILEGSVLRAGNKLRVNVQLIRVADDVPLWSGRYDRELKDVFEVQDEISGSIVNELRLKLGQGQRRYNTDLEAYDLYLQARTSVNRSRPGPDGGRIAQSIPVFQAVIAKDPSFAPAYAGIAEAYAYLSATPRSFAPKIAYAKMRIACEKALQLDPLLAEAYACMGLVESRDHNWGEAERAFRRAIQLDPNLSTARQDFALWVLTPQGRLDDAEHQLRTALELDPLSSKVLDQLDFVLVIAGRDDEVLANARRILSADPDDPYARQLSGRAWVQKGNLEEGIATFEKLGKGSESFLGYTYARAGRRADAELIAAQHRDFPWLQALVYAGLGDKDKAIEGLQNMAAIGDPRTGDYLLFPEFALLRGDPRLNSIRKTFGLPEVP